MSPSSSGLPLLLTVRFSDDRGYILYPQIGDRLDLICPASDPPGPRAPAEYEYYKLYLVSSRDQADRCEVTGTPNLLLTCDKPNSDMRFTIKFQEYSPNLWGHEFKTLHDYYIIGFQGFFTRSLAWHFTLSDSKYAEKESIAEFFCVVTSYIVLCQKPHKQN
ncbi:ephrin-B3b [Tachysurus ichikawai]